jgi:hypothetical protein
VGLTAVIRSGRVPQLRLITVVLVIIATASSAPPAARSSVAIEIATKRVVTVSRHGVFSHSIRAQTPATPRDAVKLDVTLRTPSKKRIDIGGFYTGQSIWTFRFAPAELGNWSWSARFRGLEETTTSRGTFTVVRSNSRGFVRQNPFNPARWIFADGTPYYPIGINDCTNAAYGRGPLNQWSVEGGFRQGGHDPPQVVPMGKYMRIYGKAFDLFRWGPDNCSFRLFETIAPSGNTYSVMGGRLADRLFQALRRHGFRIEMVLFGNEPPFANRDPDPGERAALHRYLRYVVDRYGAYVDYWELMNEARATDAWYDTVLGYLQSIDPYRHPVGTNFSRPELSGIDFGADHWYESERPVDADKRMWEVITASSAHRVGKPILIDELGNIGQNWDATSAERLRIRSWTAFFAEGTLVFWNASFAKDYINEDAAANVYIGPVERGYLRTLKSFTSRFDARAKVFAPTIAGEGVRGYGLVGPRDAALYLVSSDRTRPRSGIVVTVPIRRGGVGEWVAPRSGRVLASLRVQPGKQTLRVPVFDVDVAFKVSAR